MTGFTYCCFQSLCSFSWQWQKHIISLPLINYYSKLIGFLTSLYSPLRFVLKPSGVCIWMVVLLITSMQHSSSSAPRGRTRQYTWRTKQHTLKQALTVHFELVTTAKVFNLPKNIWWAIKKKKKKQPPNRLTFLDAVGFLLPFVSAYYHLVKLLNILLLRNWGVSLFAARVFILLGFFLKNKKGGILVGPKNWGEIAIETFIAKASSFCC